MRFVEVETLAFCLDSFLQGSSKTFSDARQSKKNLIGKCLTQLNLEFCYCPKDASTSCFKMIRVNSGKTLASIARSKLAQPKRLSTQMRCYASGSSGGSDMGHKKTHVLDKPASDASSNVQTKASREGMKDRAQPNETQSPATSQQDKGDNNARAKKDHPKAPEPIIGMNDERGRVGH